MDNILNEITYSDGRIENGCECSFVDTPAKLKLRAKTFDGINQAINSRQLPKKESKFSIPNAYMPLELGQYEEETDGGNFYIPSAYMAKKVEEAEYSQTDYNGLDEAMNGDANRLKVTTDKLKNIFKHAEEFKPVVNEVPIEEPEVAKVEETKPEEPIVAEVAMPAITPEEPVAIQTEPEVQEDVAEEKKEEKNSLDAALEAAREKMAAPMDTTVEKDTDTPENPVEKAKGMPAFEKLQQSVESYKEADAEVSRANALVASNEEKLKASHSLLVAEEERQNSINDEIKASNGVLDDLKKEEARILKALKEIRQKFDEKDFKIKSVTREKEKEAATARANAEKIEAENEKTLQEVGNKRQENEELNKTRDELNEKINNTSLKNAELQEELDKLKELYNGIDISTITASNTQEQEISTQNQEAQAPSTNWDNTGEGLESPELDLGKAKVYTR